MRVKEFYIDAIYVAIIVAIAFHAEIFDSTIKTLFFYLISILFYFLFKKAIKKAIRRTKQRT